MKVIIIEDEIRSAQKLSGYLSVLEEDISIHAILGSIKESVKYLKEHVAPDLIFLDVQLTDGDSFEIFKQVSTRAFIIFVTAYDQHSLKAFNLNTVSYLLKPFSQQDVAAALNKYRLYSNKRRGDTVTNRFVVRRGNRSYTISIQEVAFFEKDSVLFLVTRSGEKYLLDSSIAKLVQSLDPAKFFQINRSCLIQYDCIESFTSDSSHRYRLKLKDLGFEFIVSQSRAADFKRWIKSMDF